MQHRWKFAVLFDCSTNLADLFQLLLLVPCTTTSYVCLLLRATAILFLVFNFALRPLHHLVLPGINSSISALRSLVLHNLNITVLSYPTLPNIHTNAPLSAGSKALPGCPSHMSSITMKASMKQWWNHTDREKWSNGRKTVTTPLCPPWVPCGLAWDWSQACWVKVPVTNHLSHRMTCKGCSSPVCKYQCIQWK